jgi:phosphoglycerol transferase MdoB-like AlkP superfamily enzyme
MKQILEYNNYVIRRVIPISAFFLALQILLRLVFLVREHSNIDLSISEAASMFGMGTLFDIATLSFLLIPYIFYLVILPKNLHLGPLDQFITRLFYIITLYLLIYDVVAEWFFWDEFSVRFNFIAVDYLVYTTEVLANIWESYPIIWLLFAIAFVTAIIFLYTKSLLFSEISAGKVAFFPPRLISGIIYLFLPAILFFSINLSQSEISHNNYINEITKNGIFSLFSAFRNNELNYNKFYLSDYQDTELPHIKNLLEEKKEGHIFISDDPEDITRFIPGNGPEKHKNVIIVVMESMSASFMKRFGNLNNLTPNLDKLASLSISFDNTYATGTRTTRGLEAVTLSIPPSPGRSIIKRPNNENLFSLGFIFQDRGYDTRFIYGGYGYFDNMNYFFEHNGFDIIDRSSFSKKEQTFANAWGLCDEDLFNKVITEATRSYLKQAPFMHMIMTTSNHRPYSFPDGRVNFPPKGGGRNAAVNYADYSIGKFIENAKKTPWFNDTVFIFIADHNANSAGKTELEISKYHIPFLIYSPSFIKPQKIPNLTSQIDLAPILLGLLDFSYYSKFYGENILEDEDEKAHAFIANYQKLGFISDDSMIILKPGKKYEQYRAGQVVAKKDIKESILLDTIALYKHASNWKKNLKRIDTVVKDR